MNDGEAIELDTETLDYASELAKEAGMSTNEYLRQLLVNRASAHLKQQKAEGLFFLP